MPRPNPEGLDFTTIARRCLAAYKAKDSDTFNRYFLMKLPRSDVERETAETLAEYWIALASDLVWRRLVPVDHFLQDHLDDVDH